MGRELCMKYMPRAEEHCARGIGHKDRCLTESGVQSHRERNNAYMKKYAQTVRGKEVRNNARTTYRNTAKGMIGNVKYNATRRGNR